MTLANPYLLLLLLVIPLSILIRWRRTPGSPAGFSSTLGLSGLGNTWRLRYRWVPTVLRTAALGLLIIAVARPQTTRADTSDAEGVDLALVLDMSSSMTVYRQGNETLLSVAQRISKDFLDGLQNDRVALVIFRGESFLMSPLTSEYDALKPMIDTAVDLPLPDGTAIGVGLSEGLNALRNSRARSRAVILMTDGENNQGEIDPLAAARIAETLGVRVYTIGLIDDASRRSGRLNVDQQALEEMARVTGGRYFPATSPDLLSQVYDTVTRLEKSRLDDSKVVVVSRELAPPLILAAVLLLAAEVAGMSTFWRRPA
jgi:Ca-activated chloride channel family protein